MVLLFYALGFQEGQEISIVLLVMPYLDQNI